MCMNIHAFRVSVCLSPCACKYNLLDICMSLGPKHIHHVYSSATFNIHHRVDISLQSPLAGGDGIQQLLKHMLNATFSWPFSDCQESCKLWVNPAKSIITLSQYFFSRFVSLHKFLGAFSSKYQFFSTRYFPEQQKDGGCRCISMTTIFQLYMILPSTVQCIRCHLEWKYYCHS